GLRAIVDEEQLASLTFKSREGDQLFYTKALPEEARAMAREAQEAYEELKKSGQAESPEMKRKIAMIEQLAAQGSPVRIDATTGVLRETSIQNMTVTVDEFTWLDHVPEAT